LRYAFDPHFAKELGMKKMIAFNYSALDAQVRETAQGHAREIHEILERTAQGIVQIGLRLMECHKLLGLKFSDWLKAEFLWSQSVASNYEACAEKFGNLDCLDRFQPSALCALIRKNVDPAAIDDAVARAHRGQIVTLKTAQSLIVKHAKPGTISAASPAVHRLRNGIRQVGLIVANLTKDQRATLLDELLSLVDMLGAAPPTARLTAAGRLKLDGAARNRRRIGRESTAEANDTAPRGRREPVPA
jgi:hypothetical protein